MRVVALQQHLGNARSRAEIAVDLERRVRVEQVGVQTTPPAIQSPRRLVWHRSQQACEDLEGVVAVEEPSPEVHLPAHRPASRPVAAELEGLASRGEQIRCPERRDLDAWVQPEQVRDVAVLVVRIVHVVQPLLQLPQAAYAIRRDPFAHAPQLFPEI